MIKNILLFFAISFFLFSCKNDFEIAADWKDIPVVYAIYDPSNANHYFRIQKAYLDGSGNALTLANIPDSIYYSGDFKVTLEKANGSSFIMDKVNAIDEGIVKDTGLFVQSPLYLYKLDSTTFKTNPDEKIKLVLEHNGTELSSTSTSVIGEYYLRSTITAINFGAKNQDIKWRSNDDNSAAFFDINLHFNYLESINGGTAEEKTLIWKMIKNYPYEDGLTTYTEKIKGEDFYKFLKDQIPADASATRNFLSSQVVIYAGGQEFEEYIKTQSVAGGITSAQFVPIYTNIPNGRGLFSSKSTTINPIPFHPRALDSLKNGQYTSALNFE